jgi:hypothetical protein
MTGLLTLFGLERSIFHVPPADTLLSSVRQTKDSRALPTPGVHNDGMFIVQFDRSDPTGLKIRKRTTYPIVLDQNTYHLTCGEPMVHPFTLQAVIVHTGQEVTRGHYVVFTKLVGSPGWALCNDDKVQWVSEMEVLAQEAYILIYVRPDALQNTGIEQLADQRAATVQPGTVIHSGAVHHHSDIETSPLSGLETLIEKMTILDNKPLVFSRAEGVYPHLQKERGPLGPLSTSLPHHRPAMEDQPSESEKCRSDDQPSETEKNKSGYAEQRPVQDDSTHKEHRQPTPVNGRPLAHISSSGLPNSSALQSTGALRASSNEPPNKCWSKELDQQFQSTLKQKLSCSDSTWISVTSFVQ